MCPIICVVEIGYTYLFYGELKMRKLTGKIHQVEETIDVCDVCEKELSVENKIDWNGTWENWGDILGGRFEVCSLECLRKYLYGHKEVISLYIPSDSRENITIIINPTDAKKLYEIICREYL